MPYRHRRIHGRVPAIDVAGSIRSRQAVELLSRLVSILGDPLFMRSDNGPKFASYDILEWFSQAGIATALSESGKPLQNGVDERYAGKLHD